MTWTINYAASVRRSLKKISPEHRRRLRKFIDTRLATAQNPRSMGKALQGASFDNLWRYRVGDYRLIAQIEDKDITILIVRIGHRKDVYR